MRFEKMLLSGTVAAAMLLACCSATAQKSTAISEFGIGPGQTPTMEVGLNYAFLHANAPPAQCGCFSLNGGSGTLVVNMARGLSLVMDLASAHAGHVDGTSQNITLFNALGGLRYNYRTPRRFTPYAQVLVGESNESSNYVFVADTSALAVSGGGGVSLVLAPHIGWNILEADYIYSRLPNGANNVQSDVRAVSGIIFRFGVR